eukprot:jgi/Ulvmu1/12811/UM097_0040.1
MDRGYQNFGSFFTPSVQSMIRDDAWKVPALPATVEAIRNDSNRDTQEFGPGMRAKFLIDFDAFTFINHGAFGGCMRHVLEEVGAWQAHCEAQPLRFIDRELFGHMVNLIRDMADFVACDHRELVFLPNVTTAISTVLFSIDLTTPAPDGVSPAEVLMLDIGYGSVKKAAQEACERGRARLVQAHVPLPLPEQGAEGGIESRLLGGLSPATRVVVLDAVASNTAVALPLPRLIQACRDRVPGVLVVVDAAHALGQQPLSLAALGADYVAANCHKWLCGPRGSAVLWAAQRHHVRLRPLVVSHGHGHGFTSDFIWDGNRDYAPYLAVGGALAWWRAHGRSARQYMHDTLAAAVQLLLRRWRSGVLAPLRLCAAMACVRLPDALQSRPPGSSDSADGKQLQEALYAHGVEVPVKVHAGSLYVRISVHVYNTEADYTALADAVNAIAAQLPQSVQSRIGHTAAQ